MGSCKCVNWSVWLWAGFAASSGFAFGYDSSSINGVKEMIGYRQTLGIPYVLLSPDDENIAVSNFSGSCTSQDDVKTSAILGILVSILSIGSLFGALISGALSDVVGRKLTLHIGSLVYAIGGAIHTFSFFLWMAFLGRIVSGFGIGILFQVAPLYIAEISPKKLRGRLITLLNTSATFGLLLGFVINSANVHYSLGWRVTLGVHCLVGSVLALGMILIPETPRWLVKKSKKDAALTVLKRIHKVEQEAKNELNDIILLIDTEKQGWTAAIKYCCGWNIIQRVLLGFFLQLLGRLMGINLLVYYSVTIFCTVGIPGYYGSILVGVAIFLVQFLGYFLYDKVGRKPILLFGALITGVSYCSAATLIQLYNLDDVAPGDEGSSVRYFVVFFMILSVTSFSASFSIIPWIFCSEIYPLRSRGITIAISSMGWWFGTFIIGEVAPVLLSSPLNLSGSFYLFAGICVLTFLYVLFFIPETKGQSLEKVDELFAKPWLKRVNILYYLRFGLSSRTRERFRRKSSTRVELVTIHTSES